MAIERSQAIDALLVQTAEAHGVHEATELNGVYDQEWPRWYAAYAVEQGLATLVGHPITSDELARFLASSNVEFEQADPKPTDPWATYTARRIATEL